MNDGLKEHRLSYALLTVALLLLGFGQIFILPPFEGLDETAHYSSIKQIADTGTLPMAGSAYLAQQMVDYSEIGPMPYRAIEVTEPRGAYTYPEFFKDKAREKNYLDHYRAGAFQESFTAGMEGNWQAQHPPLYYGILAPVAIASAKLSFVGQILALRMASFALALGGFFIALTATIRSGIIERRYALIGFFVYPLLVPEFFPEFGRMGNDSLCLLLMGVTWALLLRWLRDEFNMPLTFALGGTLGLGLMTKAFFVPISSALLVFLLIRLWQARRDKKLLKNRYEMLFPLFLPCVFAGFWYVYQAKATGTISGGRDFGSGTAQGEFLSGFIQNFSVKDFLGRISGLMRSWVWGGTASLGQWPTVFTIVLTMIDLIIIVSGLRRLRTTPPVLWLLPISVCLFSFGLLYHIVTLIRLNSSAGTPGWYFSILMPMFAVTIGRGYAVSKEIRYLMPAACLYGAAFLAMAIWGEAAEFSGCAMRDEFRSYIFTKPVFCMTDISEMLRRLAVLAYPTWGFWMIASGFALYGVGLTRILKTSEIKLPAP